MRNIKFDEPESLTQLLFSGIKLELSIFCQITVVLITQYYQESRTFTESDQLLAKKNRRVSYGVSTSISGQAHHTFSRFLNLRFFLRIEMCITVFCYRKRNLTALSKIKFKISLKKFEFRWCRIRENMLWTRFQSVMKTQALMKAQPRPNLH